MKNYSYKNEASCLTLRNYGAPIFSFSAEGWNDRG